jgi:hypothetical protein
MSYIRVKRKKQTVFLYTEPSEAISSVKAKIAKLNNVSSDKLRLIFNNVPLEETKTISDYNIENDNVVHLVYKKDGSDEYEAIDVQSTDK